MAYRDELETARARVEELERQLAESRAELAATRERRSQALVLADRGALEARGRSDDRSPATRWLGAPARLVFTRTIDGHLPESAHAQLIELVRERMGDVGTISRLEGSLAWTSTVHKGASRIVSLTVTSRGGTTTLRLDERLGNLAGGIFGGVGGGVGGSTLFLPVLATVASPLLGALLIPAWLGATWFGCRTIYRRMARRRAEDLQALADALAEIATEAIAAAPR